MRLPWPSALLKPSWKKASLFTCAIVLPLPILLVSRYNISPQDSVSLAAIQRLLGINHPSDLEEEDKPEIIGHRGSGGSGIVENTVGAITAGMRAEVDWIEIDVRKAKDQLVLFHDESIASPTGETVEEAAQVRDLTLEALRNRQGSVTADDRIISLKEALEDERFEGVNWVIDIKEPGMKQELLDALKGLPRDRIVLQGLFDIIREYQESGYALAYAAGWGEGSNKTRFLLGHGFIVERCEKLGPDLRYLSLPSVFVNRSLIDDVKKKFPGIQVWSWRAETKESWERNTGLGVDGLIVDDVEGVRSLFP